MTSRAFNGLLGPGESRTLVRAYAALRDLPEDLTQRMLSAGGQQLSGGWDEELQGGTQFSDQQRRVVGSNPSAVARTTGLTVATGGTGPLAELTRGFEFGAINREEFVTYVRRGRTGTAHTVKRRTKRQMPTRSQTGWIAYPAGRRLRTRVVRMYQQIIVKVAHDAIEGR